MPATDQQTSVSFPALGAEVFVGVRRGADLATAQRLAEGVLDDVDRVCSRFRDDSDLTRANARPGHWVAVDPLLVAAVQVACDAARLTGGLVNPLLGRPLVHLGYDRDFQLLVEHEDDGRVTETPLPTPERWREIGLDPEGAVRVPEGTALDLGATGKAWAADLAAAAYVEHLGGSAIISVGGDLRIARPDGDPWLVSVAERPGDPPQELVTLDRGGLATSSTRVRRWTRHGVRRHHLLDPRTGQPATEVWRAVTATGATCVAANTATTAAVVLGEEAPDWLAAHSVTARLVALDGAVRTVGAWPTDGPREGSAA